MSESENHLWSDAAHNVGRILAILVQRPVIVYDKTQETDLLDIFKATWLYGYLNNTLSICSLENFIDESAEILHLLRSTFISPQFKPEISRFFNLLPTLVYYHPHLATQMKTLDIKPLWLLGYLKEETMNIVSFLYKHYQNEVDDSIQILASIMLNPIRDILDKKIYDLNIEPDLRPYMHQILDFGLSLKKGEFPKKNDSNTKSTSEQGELKEKQIEATETLSSSSKSLDNLNEKEITFKNGHKNNNSSHSKKRKRHKRKTSKFHDVKPSSSEKENKTAHSRPKTSLEKLNFLLAYCDCEPVTIDLTQNKKDLTKESQIPDNSMEHIKRILSDIISNVVKDGTSGSVQPSNVQANETPEEPLMEWLVKEAQILKENRDHELRQNIFEKRKMLVCQVFEINKLKQSDNNQILNDIHYHTLFIKAPFYVLNPQLREACVKKYKSEEFKSDFLITEEIRQDTLFTLINTTLIELILQIFETDKKETHSLQIPLYIQNTYWLELLHRHNDKFHLAISEDLLEIFENVNARIALCNKYQHTIDCAKNMDEEYDREGGILSIIEKSLPIMMLSTPPDSITLRKKSIHLYRQLRILEENEGFHLSDDWQSLEYIHLKLLNHYKPKNSFCSELYDEEEEISETEKVEGDEDVGSKRKTLTWRV